MSASAYDGITVQPSVASQYACSAGSVVVSGAGPDYTYTSTYAGGLAFAPSQFFSGVPHDVIFSRDVAFNGRMYGCETSRLFLSEEPFDPRGQPIVGASSFSWVIPNYNDSLASSIAPTAGCLYLVNNNYLATGGTIISTQNAVYPIFGFVNKRQVGTYVIPATTATGSVITLFYYGQGTLDTTGPVANSDATNCGFLGLTKNARLFIAPCAANAGTFVSGTVTSQVDKSFVVNQIEILANSGGASFYNGSIFRIQITVTSTGTVYPLEVNCWVSNL